MDEGADEKTTSDNAPTMDIRNATVHLKVTDGSEALVAEIFECTQVYPDRLLEEHKHLVESNFTKLDTGPVKDKVEFVAEMNAARSLARHIAKETGVALKTNTRKLEESS